MSLKGGCLPLLLLGSSHPTHASCIWMPNVLCLLCDVGVTNVKRWWCDCEGNECDNIDNNKGYYIDNNKGWLFTHAFGKQHHPAHDGKEW